MVWVITLSEIVVAFSLFFIGTWWLRAVEESGNLGFNGTMMEVSSLKVMVVRAGQISLYKTLLTHGIYVVLG